MAILTVPDNDLLAHRFERDRPHLRAVAYRMLGSLTETRLATRVDYRRVVN